MTALPLHTMFYSSEVRAVDEFRADPSHLSAQELELAALLVRALAGPFEPAKYHDHYQENLRALLDAKIQGKEMEERVAQPLLAPVVDILEALQASLARKKEARPVAGQHPPTEVSRRKRSRSVG